ncbi:hypothetical protein COV05_03285 [Candidatus Uhrbacteria bacterium CG10_big_fil_rev_8_21_14_0_10_48_16]|uniref:Phospholipase C/D domain-containing protein n=1 Tax=Candidatus Uhrbacteria bacterium CG10_big_fil_rev_8_21_14_0_10_48_16 TaxID=1975038 RepID=A0A2M8LGZ7_9BACT|nr:MAG: hypothetical protein COV05_03285 [Candidatus Uhrbacteria bacterium CG10_big_fil_rev_8_21_14_0_10_48_16]
MAMELTHVRFAQDLKNRLGIENESAYYAGTIYPDSRYMTKIDRNLTHAGTSPQDPFVEGLTDFEKGWATHLLYDRLAHPQYAQLSPWPSETVEQGNHVWQFISAAKVVEDMQSYEVMGGTVDMILNIDFQQRPNDEDPSIMRAYAQIQKTLYQQTPALEHYRNFWVTLSSNTVVIDGVMKHVTEMLSNDSLQKNIRGIYASVLDELAI